MHTFQNKLVELQRNHQFHCFSKFGFNFSLILCNFNKRNSRKIACIKMMLRCVDLFYSCIDAIQLRLLYALMLIGPERHEPKG